MLISVVVPLLNEADNLPELTDRLRKVLSEFDCDWEIILVDDGSQDNSWNIIESLHRNDTRFQGIQLSRNFGQQPALMAGLRHACGDVVIPMDADLQDPPEVIAQLLDKWKQGFQVVYAIRQNRKEGWIRNKSASAFYRILQRFTQVKIALDSGDYCLLDRKVVNAICRFTEQHPFIRGLRSWVGFRQTGVAFDRGIRYKGKSRYSIRGLITLAIDGFFSVGLSRFKLVIYFGMIVAIVSIIGGVCNAFGFLAPQYVKDIPVLLMVLLLLCGIQLIVLGLIGGYLHRIFNEMRGRPVYVIAKTLPSSLVNSDEE